ncbi:MAG TPA: tetratricopeptide repeat-containing diguanylate cyclase [Thermoanaerobaculia bacterium]|jgi:diguanylate cyclase (GGDEF)-like protein|nr:tetratricopeptide repeat-containing diguanylate cyclase [Thermoanaerobaculia bacterium]
MSFPRLLVCTVLCLVGVARAVAADTGRLPALLDEAERIRKSDKPKARQLLDAVEREKASDPEIVAREQLLECKWADAPAAAYRAVTIGLAAAERAKSVGLRAKLVGCHAGALATDGKAVDAEREYGTTVVLARQAHDRALEAEALGDVGYLQYTRGAMADALTNLQTAYRLSTAIGDEKGRLDVLSIIANVYADAHVAQYDRAIEYYHQLAGEYEKHGQPGDVADTLFNIASTYETKGDLAAAELHYRRALASFQKLGQPKDVAFTRRSLASALMKQGRAAEALPLLDEVVRFYEREHDQENIAWARQSRGMAYRRLGNLTEALREFDFARQFFEQQKNVRFLEKNAEEVALVYAQRGDWRNAYEANTRHAALAQTLAATRNDELSSRLRVAFDSEKKEQENRALARENGLRAVALREAERSRKLQLVVSALIAMLAVALGILFWRQVVNTRRMRAMAMTDELTRLPNRRHILVAAGIALDAAKRDGRPAAVIVLDIDHFKRINDTWGHAAGDTVLQNVARTCRAALRPADQIGRIGGEEFLVILHSATEQQAREIAERLRTAVERLDLTSIASDLRVTISLGVHVTRNDHSSAAIAAADSMLYRAKESGRNRVEMEVAIA